MTDFNHCPVCKTAPWNGSDGAYGVCPSCQVAGVTPGTDEPVSEPSPDDERHWFECPSCHGREQVDLDQWKGEISIVCDHCDWHGYREPAEG